MTLEELIAGVNDAGYSVHGLFQLSSLSKHRWRACINDGQHCWEFGEADTPYLALLNAVEKATTTPSIELSTVKPSVIIETAVKSKKKITLADL